jgi:lipopolysaccharide transport system ATP-binding protein
MNDIAIQVDQISKRYRIGKSREGHNNRPRLQMFTSPFRYLADSFRKPDQDEILWAIRNISFEVKRGEVIGIIGRNGAGKSTLLKILSRITEPTSGRALIQGRVGSLLEVGTGFHPELTGRENIFLSGAILGMKQVEINQKFKDIVQFAEIEKFLDTPVKRYSSGMYVRLAFSVAAHLEPEILLVDEVLAVGDAAFQKKCLGKMGDVATQGRTVLFVSHNMVAVQNLCNRVFWLDGGELKLEGPTAQAVSKYFSNAYQSQTEKFWADIHSAPGNDKVRIHSMRIRPQPGCRSDLISMETPLQVEIEYWNLVPNENIHVTLHLFNEQQIVVLTTASIDGSETAVDKQLSRGLYRSVCLIPANLLNEGFHRIALLVLRNTSKIIYKDEEALTFDVLDLGSRSGAWFGKEPGVIRPILPWETEKIGDL